MNHKTFTANHVHLTCKGEFLQKRSYLNDTKIWSAAPDMLWYSNFKNSWSASSLQCIPWDIPIKRLQVIITAWTLFVHRNQRSSSICSVVKQTCSLLRSGSFHRHITSLSTTGLWKTHHHSGQIYNYAQNVEEATQHYHYWSKTKSIFCNNLNTGALTPFLFSKYLMFTMLFLHLTTVQCQQQLTVRTL